MDASQWTQGSFPVDIKPPHMESSRQQEPLHQQQQQQERKAVRPHKDQAYNCPRCNSTNTKFCYYNNYSLSQPRYFCKTCRRYWTEGGSLRNVPVGGGSRKNKRSSSSTSSSSSGSKTKLPVEHHQQDQGQNPRIIHQGQDLNLAFPPPSDHDRDENPKSPSIDLLKGNSGIASMGLSLGSFMPHLPILETSTSYSAGFPLMEFRPSLGFPNSDGFENGYGSLQGLQESSSTGAKLFFPVEDLKQVPGPTPSSGTNRHHHHHHHQQFDHNRQQGDPSGYWNGVLGGGSW